MRAAKEEEIIMRERMLNAALCALLALSLLSGAALADSVNLYPYDYADPDSLQVDHAAVIGDKLYLLATPSIGNESLLAVWSAGMTEPEILIDELPPLSGIGNDRNRYVNHLFGDETGLYGMSAYYGHVMRLTDAAGAAAPEEICRVDMSVFAREDGAEYDGETRAVFLSDGELYVLKAIYDYNNGDETRVLCRFNLETGELIERREDNGLFELVPCQGGKCLALYLPDGRYYDEETGESCP